MEECEVGNHSPSELEYFEAPMTPRDGSPAPEVIPTEKAGRLIPIADCEVIDLTQEDMQVEREDR